MERFPDFNKRWGLLLVLMAAVLVGYMARMSVSVALPQISRDFGWTRSAEGTLGGVLLGIFLVSYGFSNIFFSKYIDIYGPRVMLTISLAVWSLSVAIGAYFGYIYWMFLLSRVLLGLGQGVLYPTASKVTHTWFPIEERSRANSIFMIGGPMGVMLAPVVMSPIMVSYSWEISFYLVALLGFLIIMPVMAWFEDGDEGRGREAEDEEGEGEAELDIWPLLKDRDFQVILIVFTSMTGVWWGVTLWIPAYLVESLHVNISDLTLGAAIPYMGAVFSMYLGSWISDRTGKRKPLILVSLISTGSLISLLTLMPIDSVTVAVGILFVIFFAGQLAPPLFFTLLQVEVSEEVIGAATGLMNGIGNGVGILGPLAVGLLISATGSYDIGLLSLAVIAFVGVGAFLFLDNG